MPQTHRSNVLVWRESEASRNNDNGQRGRLERRRRRPRRRRQGKGDCRRQRRHSIHPFPPCLSLSLPLSLPLSLSCPYIHSRVPLQCQHQHSVPHGPPWRTWTTHRPRMGRTDATDESNESKNGCNNNRTTIGAPSFGRCCCLVWSFASRMWRTFYTMSTHSTRCTTT